MHQLIVSLRTFSPFFVSSLLPPSLPLSLSLSLSLPPSLSLSLSPSPSSPPLFLPLPSLFRLHGKHDRSTWIQHPWPALGDANPLLLPTNSTRRLRRRHIRLSRHKPIHPRLLRQPTQRLDEGTARQRGLPEATVMAWLHADKRQDQVEAGGRPPPNRWENYRWAGNTFL